MLDTLTSRNHTDFRQRYQNTYGFLVLPDKKILVHLIHVDDKMAKFVDIKKSEYYAYSNSEQIFEFIQVSRGWFNTNKGLYYLTRVPARQWKRGICEDNTEVWTLDDKSFNRGEVSLKSLTEVFVNTLDTHKAMEEFFAGARQGLALTHHFAVTRQQVYFDNKIIGKVDVGENAKISLTHDIVQQELLDGIKRGSLSRFTVEAKQDGTRETN